MENEEKCKKNDTDLDRDIDSPSCDKPKPAVRLFNRLEYAADECYRNYVSASDTRKAYWWNQYLEFCALMVKDIKNVG